jgi:methionine-rich copper-binding protein CopC
MRAVLRRVLPALMVALVFAPAVATAHSNSVDSDPADDSTLPALPRVATVTFNEPVSQAAVALTGPDRKVTKIHATVAGTVVSAALPKSGLKGAYVLAYRVVSEDGHPVTGEVEFTVTVGEKVSGQARASTSPRSESAASGVPMWVLIGGAAVLLGVAITLVRAARK